jgi:hypothetical protein
LKKKIIFLFIKKNFFSRFNNVKLNVKVWIKYEK